MLHPDFVFVFSFQFGGMKEGDFIVSIGDKDVKWAAHEQVVKLIKEAGDSLTLKLVTPMDRNYLKVSQSLFIYWKFSFKCFDKVVVKLPLFLFFLQAANKNSNKNSGSVSAGSSSGEPSPACSVAGSTTKKLTWNPFRKQRERDSSFEASNVILR